MYVFKYTRYFQTPIKRDLEITDYVIVRLSPGEGPCTRPDVTAPVSSAADGGKCLYFENSSQYTIVLPGQ